MLALIVSDAFATQLLSDVLAWGICGATVSAWRVAADLLRSDA